MFAQSFQPACFLLFVSMLLLTSCASSDVSPNEPPKVTISTPKQSEVGDNKVKVMDVAVTAKGGVGSWKPGKMQVKLTRDIAGKHELANSLMNRADEGDSGVYRERLAWPKTKGKYYLHFCLYEDASGNSGSNSTPKTYEPKPFAVEVK